jgi:hypothetical protein
MPTQALALALAASIYPPAAAAVIALGRGSEVRSRVFVFVLAALLTTYAVGVAILFVLVDVGATGSRKWTPSGAIDVALGVALLLLAVRLDRRGRRPQAEGSDDTAVESGGAAVESGGTSKIARYLESRRLAFVLGITLYALPSPIYIGAVKATGDAKLSTSSELLALVVTVVVMLWMIEVPMLMLLVVPDRASAMLEAINAWFGRRGRLLAVLASAGAGAYLLVNGLIGLIS